MRKITKAKPILSNEEIQNKIKETVGFWRVQKWLIVHNALNYPRNSTEIANHLLVSKSLVHKTISEFNRFGASSIETRGKGGRRNSYLTLEEEHTFMDGFITQAQKGHIATAGQIKESYEKLIGNTVHKTTIYRLLERNGWRKIVPLPHHPKKDIQAQEDFKKTLDKK
ncbi:MAG: winged helix-turn-helix domain-containing protein [Candidatus Kapabacteria bacterium]|nr:winged helix-turn-helix domain-containing protein [Candidatus Kapabacteria bacterium]